MEDAVHTVFEIGNIPVTNVVIMMWIAMIFIIIWAYLSTKKMQEVPSGLQHTAEVVVEFLNNLVGGIIGNEAAKKFVPYIGTVALFLAVSNTIGALFMGELTNGLIAPPTRTLGVPVALALMTLILAIVSGIRKNGIKAFIKKLFKPFPLMLPFNLLEYITKPLSLSMRLFGNIFGAYVLMELLIASFPAFFPSIACLYFDLFDGLLQTYVFVLLTSIYVSEEYNLEEE